MLIKRILVSKLGDLNSSPKSDSNYNRCGTLFNISGIQGSYLLNEGI